MKKKIIGTIAALTIVFTVLTQQQVRSELKVQNSTSKIMVNANSFTINEEAALPSKANKANLSQADGGEYITIQ